jgi:hypothetical protein
VVYIQWGCKQPKACWCSNNLHGIHEGPFYELQVLGVCSVYEIKRPMFFEGAAVSLLYTVNFDTIRQRINRRRKFMVTSFSTMCHIPYNRFPNDSSRRGIQQTVDRAVCKLWSPDLRLCSYYL